MGQVIDLPNREPTRPIAENGKVVQPRRLSYRERRSREHLAPTEIAQLLEAAGLR
jgi:hypothetical protein